MKAKRVNKITVELADWERERLVREINRCLSIYGRTPGSGTYPLGLHDFGKLLAELETEA